MRRWTAIVGVACVLALVGCTSSTKVGNSNLLNVKQKTSGGFDATTTTLPKGTLPPAASTTAPPTTKPSAVTAPKRTTTTISPQQQQAITANIKIEGASSAAFNPSFQEVYPGTPVKWTNTDTVARSVVSDDGSTFNSGPIPPGGTYTWKTTGGARKIAYHDGTRPYAVAELQVVPSP